MISFAVQGKHTLSTVAATAAFFAGSFLSAQTITTVVGNGTNGYTADGAAPTATELSVPSSVAFDSSGNMYISDQGNFRIRKVSGGVVSTFVGNGTAGNDQKGKSGVATTQEISGVTGLAFDSSGNLYLADTDNDCVQKVTAGGTISTVAGVCGTEGFLGDAGAATSANMTDPSDVVFDSSGNMYISDSVDDRIRLVTTSTGIITTFAGNGGAELTGDGGLAVNASLYNPVGVAFDAAGNLYIADTDNNAVRLVTPAGAITTIAGTSGIPGFSGDGGPATDAQLNKPFGVAVDAAGNVFISDNINCRIREVSTAGVITTIAGTGAFGFAGDGGPAAKASLLFPSGLTLDAAGDLYIADSGNGSIREITTVGVPKLAAAPAIGAGGIITSSGFGAFTSIAPGSLIEIYGTNLGVDTNLWASRNFISGVGPTWLDGTTVTIGGMAAFIVYVSPLQINAFVPYNVPTGSQPVIVTNSGGSSVAENVNVVALEPGLLATPPFIIGGTQFAVALSSDFSAYIAPAGAIAGATSSPAQPGDIIVLFGSGFGPVSQAIVAGQIENEPSSLVNQVQFSIGGVPTTTTYQGLAPGEAGIYQFDIVVPNVPSGNLPITFTQANGNGSAQTLVVAIQD